MSNWLGVEHQPDKFFVHIQVPCSVFPSTAVEAKYPKDAEEYLFGALSVLKTCVFLFLDLVKVIFLLCTMVNHYKPPFGKICFIFSKHLKQIQVLLGCFLVLKSLGPSMENQ